VLQVPRNELSCTPDINEVSVAYLREAGVKAETRKRLIQKRIETIMAERPWPVPEPLQKLSAVTDFDLFISTTTDSLLRLQPPNLFDELRDKHLLFLGCGFPDGLARILVRTLANKRLFGSNSRNKVADSRASGDANLSLFLQHCGTEIYVAGDAPEFISKLFEKWRNRAGSAVGAGAARSSDARWAVAPRPPPGSIFLSYKSEDVTRVARLKDALEKAGLDVWFDKQDLQGGDDWDQKIEKGIENCTLFIPIISRNSQTVEGEFRREWNRALRRAERMPREVPFIVATLIDTRSELRRGDGPWPILIPEEFWKKQFIQCLAQDPTDQFVQTVKTQMRQAQLLRGGL
jgi:hypothetical protein